MSHVSKILAAEATDLKVANGLTLRQQGSKWLLLDEQLNNVEKHGDAFIYTHKNPSDHGIVSISTGDLPEGLRRKGVATSVYLALAKFYGKIRSDTAMSEDAADLWRSLVKKHGAKVISTDLEEHADSPSPYFPESAKHQDYKYDPKTEYWRFELEGK